MKKVIAVLAVVVGVACCAYQAGYREGENSYWEKIPKKNFLGMFEFQPMSYDVTFAESDYIPMVYDLPAEAVAAASVKRNDVSMAEILAAMEKSQRAVIVRHTQKVMSTDQALASPVLGWKNLEEVREKLTSNYEVLF